MIREDTVSPNKAMLLAAGSGIRLRPITDHSAFFDVPFLVWYGDNLSNCDLHRLFTFHHAKRSLATIALYYRDDATSSGIVGLDENGRIERFLEKPRPEEVFSYWCNAGIYVLEPAVLATVPATGQPDFGHDIFPSMLAKGERLHGYRLAAY